MTQVLQVLVRDQNGKAISAAAMLVKGDTDMLVPVYSPLAGGLLLGSVRVSVKEGDA